MNTVLSCLLLLALVAESMSFNIYTARGSFFEVGEQIGRQAKKEIDLALARPEVRQKVVPFIASGTGKVLFEGLFINSAKRYPQLIQEIHGLASGSGRTVDEIFLLNALDELTTYIGVNGPPEHCTDVLTNSLTPSWGHNEDGDVYDRQTTYFTNVTVLDGAGNIAEMFVAFTYPGTVAGDAYGWNHHGLVFSQNAVEPTYLNYYGVPGQLTARAAYGAKSLDHAFSILSNSGTANGYNLNIGVPKDNRIVNIEQDPLGGFGAHEIPSALNLPKYTLPNAHIQPFYFYHANMYRFLWTPCVWDPSSSHRLAVLDKYPAPTKTDDIRQMLGDTSDPQYPIYRTGANGPDSPYATLTTVIYDFVSMTASVYDSNPRTGKPFKQFQLW